MIDRETSAGPSHLDHELGEVSSQQYDVRPARHAQLAPETAERRTAHGDTGSFADQIRLVPFGAQRQSWRGEPGSRAAALTSISSSGQFPALQ